MTTPTRDGTGAAGNPLVIDAAGCDYVIALAGNPNTGKSTVFNALTGLRQHTGNWPGKTVARAEGSFEYASRRYRIVDLPGTYSLLSASPDEDVARDALFFGRPDVTVVVVDATRLERNLSLLLQILSISGRVVVCLNLVDEAARHGLQVDAERLAADLGVTVVPTAARSGTGIDDLRAAIDDVATDLVLRAPRPLPIDSEPVAAARSDLAASLVGDGLDGDEAAWIALRLLDGDRGIADTLRSTRLLAPAAIDAALERAAALRLEVGENVHDALSESIYRQAGRLADAAVRSDGGPGARVDGILDGVLTGRWTGFPVMFLLLAAVFWITVEGANVPSAMLSAVLLDTIYPWLRSVAGDAGVPWWISGLLLDGVYLAVGWVIAVMLPPMAIFFPLFTLLEDFGYLPRVAFNLDSLFRRVGAHGKQALTLSMGFGCNAAGIIACRIIDSPRERLIAIITNNFSLCNGRWPTQILIASIFVGALAPAEAASVVAAAAVVGVAVFGMALTFAVSWALSRTTLRGEPSVFHLELPPYRPPRVWQTLYTSLIDRTIFVLWRAIVFAGPAGAVIWLVANIHIGDHSLAVHMVDILEPFGLLLGLNGVILLAYIIAVPANEIVVPTVLMLTVLTTGAAGGEGTGVMFELDSLADTEAMLRAGGWTTLTAACVMLFSLVHNPCSTTLYTIYKETASKRWTVVSALLPLIMGFVLCAAVAATWRWLG